MKKAFKRVILCFSLVCGILAGTLISDRQALQQELIRLHVVGASDSSFDQTVKLRVRDAVLESIGRAMASAGDARAAEAYLMENLPRIQQAANETLRILGVSDRAVVTLCKEAFDTRVYDTFTLPAGIYEALRVTIGEGEGHNWWCVAFPTLCLPAVTRDVEALASDAGLPDTAVGAITGRYRLRFYFLDALGRLESRLRDRS